MWKKGVAIAINGKSIKLLGILAAVGLLVAACGGGAEPTATPQPTPTKAPTATSPAVGPTPVATPTPAPPTPTPALTVKRGGVLKLVTNSDLASLDGSKFESFTIAFTVDTIWSNLTMFRAESWTDTAIIGDLAERWDVSDGGKTFTFHINPNARWQNIPPVNGRALTAADVKWSLDLYRDPAYGSAIAGRIGTIASVEAPDKTTVVIRLKSPARNFLNDMAWSTVKVLAKEVLDKDGSFEKTVIGSGEFQFDRWERGSRVVMKANPTFWLTGVDGKPLPYLSGLEFLIIIDPQTTTAALKTGLLDSVGVGGGVDKQAADQLKAVRSIILTPGHSVFIAILGFNHTVKPFDDVRVRRAFLKATDVPFIMRNVLEAPEAPLDSFVYSLGSDVDYPQAKLQKILTRDLAGARKLLADAGLSAGLKTELLATVGIYSGIATAVKQQWAEIGVQVSISTGDTLTVFGRRQKSDFEMISSPLNLQAEPLGMLIPQWGTGGARNFYKYSNPKVDALLAEALAEFDQAKFKQKLEEVQDLMWEDVAGIPISAGVTFLFQRTYIKGWIVQWAWGNQGLRWAWLDK